MTDPNVSPDGQWRWDGTQWVPNQSGYGYPPPATTGYAGSGFAGTGYPAPYPPAYPAAPTSTTDGKAIASLVLALVGLCGLGSIAAIVLGHLSRRDARREGRPPSGIALAGIIVGYVGLVGALLVAGLFVLGANVNGEFHTARVCQVTPSSNGCA